MPPTAFNVIITEPVDGSGNAETNTPLSDTAAGFVSDTSCDDEGVITGSRFMVDNYASDDYRLAVGRCTPLLDYNFNGTAQATGQWKCLYTTMTMTEGGGSVLCNANSTGTGSTGCALSTWAYFKLQGGAELYAAAEVTATPFEIQINQVAELGLFLPTATSAPADGAYFRLAASGTQGVVNFNGAETVLPFPTSYFGTGNGAKLISGTVYRLGINITTYKTEFWINDVLAGSIATPAGQGTPFATIALPYTFQLRNTGSVSPFVAQLKVSLVHIEQDDLDLVMPYPHVLSAAGQSSGQGQEGGTVGSTANLPNSAGGSGPGAAALNNTTANVTGLGGIAAVTPSYAVNDDGLVFDYTNPAGGIAQVPRKLIITGVRVQGAVTSALTGGPVTYLYQLAYGHSAVSLATAESASFNTATAKAPRKVAIGIDTYASGAIAGVLGSGIMDLDLSMSPVTVNPGEHVAVVARNLASTATGTITVTAAFRGYWV
jgi:hypothetical protein